MASESSDPVHGDASSPWCVVDFFVPPTKEEAAASAAKAEAAAKLAAEKEAARAAAEEAGEPLPEEDVAKDAEEPTPPPPPREILRSLKFSGAFPSQLVSVYELISSVSKSYAAKKAREAPPPPTEEEIAAAAAAAAAAAEEEAAAAAAKAKGKKKGKGDPEPEQEEVPVAPPSDPNDPIQPGAFLWEAIYPKTAPGSTTPRYNPSGRYAVRIFVNNAWRRVDVDDRIPVDSKEGRPLLPFSENKFELWPLIIAKAICVVTRGRWADAGCLTWINNLCGWVTESTLVAELPPGDDDLDGREHFQSLTMQTWPRILPAVPHQVIVYEEDSDSEEDGALGDDNEEDEGLFGAIDAAEGLLAGAGDGTDNGGEGQAENGGEEKTGSEADGSEGGKDGVSGSSSKALLLAGSPPFEIHLLMVGDDSVVANGANKVGAEAAEAALEEVYADPDAPKAPPPSLLARCVYHLVATRVSLLLSLLLLSCRAAVDFLSITHFVIKDQKVFVSVNQKSCSN